VEIYLKYHRPVNPRTILRALSAMKLTNISVPVVDMSLAEGDMTSYVFEGELCKAFNVTASFAKRKRKKGYPIPSSSSAVFEIRPDDIDDEIIDYGD
jgi:hypothetical protein